MFGVKCFVWTPGRVADDCRSYLNPVNFSLYSIIYNNRSIIQRTQTVTSVPVYEMAETMEAAAAATRCLKALRVY